MDGTRRQKRSTYVTLQQKKKLVELVTKNPNLIKGRFTPEFTSQDCQQLWQNIGRECNAIPGGRKTWKQWRKTWQDLRSKWKKQQKEGGGRLPRQAIMLTAAERTAVGLKNVTSLPELPEPDSEFVILDESNYQISVSNGGESNDGIENSDGESVAGEVQEQIEELFVHPPQQKVQIPAAKINNREPISSHSDNCAFNCDILTSQEQKKIQIKEDYLNFKKDYLRQKLELLREQTDALKTIARELMNKR